MSRREAGRRLAVLALMPLVLGATAGAPTPAPRPDVADTHQRIDRIYQRLGITEEHDEPSSAGCGKGWTEEKHQDQPRRSAPLLPPWLGYVLVGVVFAAMLIPLLLVLRSGYRESASIKGPAAVDEDLDEPTTATGPWRVDLSECRRLVAAGQIGEALAALHRLTLLALEHAGHLALDATTTNWEYVRRLGGRPSLRQLLAAVTEAAERAVLGDKRPGVEHYRRLEQLVLAEIER